MSYLKDREIHPLFLKRTACSGFYAVDVQAPLDTMVAMSRMLSLLVSVMLLLTLGLVQAPRMCVGDGDGGACRPEACACVAACSCQEAHRRAAADASDCCAVSFDDEAPTATACHGPNDWPHFAPPDRHWYALVPAWPVFDWRDHAHAEPPAQIARSAYRSQAPPERPPRLLGET